MYNNFYFVYQKMRFSTVLVKLYNYSARSPCNMKHAAAITQKGEIISVGYNQPSGDKGCSHAEEEAIRYYFLLPRKQEKK